MEFCGISVHRIKKKNTHTHTHRHAWIKARIVNSLEKPTANWLCNAKRKCWVSLPRNFKRPQMGHSFAQGDFLFRCYCSGGTTAPLSTIYETQRFKFCGYLFLCLTSFSSHPLSSCYVFLKLSSWVKYIQFTHAWHTHHSTSNNTDYNLNSQFVCLDFWYVSLSHVLF